jgi:hypothetical protein
MTGIAHRPIIAVPAAAIRMTSTVFRSAGDLEACCFWFGRRLQSDIAAVEAIVIPRQQNAKGQYHIEAASMVQVANVAREFGWKNLAQVHSHPGKSVRHSGYDDEMANTGHIELSRVPGSLLDGNQHSLF